MSVAAPVLLGTARYFVISRERSDREIFTPAMV